MWRGSDEVAGRVKWLDERGYKGNDYVPHDTLTEWKTTRTSKELKYVVGPTGVMQGKMGIKDAGDAMVRRRQERE